MLRTHSTALPCPRQQRGQASSEYLVISAALVAAGLWVMNDAGPVEWMLDALRAFHRRFATALSLPL